MQKYQNHILEIPLATIKGLYEGDVDIDEKEYYKVSIRDGNLLGRTIRK